MEKIGLIDVRWRVLCKWLLGWTGWFLAAYLAWLLSPTVLVTIIGTPGVLALLWPWIEAIEKEKGGVESILAGEVRASGSKSEDF